MTRTAARWHRLATRDQARDLAAIRAANPTPTPSPPAPPAPAVVYAPPLPAAPHPQLALAAQPTAPAAPPLARPVVWTAPHYVQVAPPPGVQRQYRPRRAMPLLVWFKFLVVLGFVYALAMACLVTVAANHLNNRTTTDESPSTPFTETNIGGLAP